MKHIFFKSFATKLSICILSFTLIIFTAIMVFFYTYSRERTTEYAIKQTHGLLSNMATKISSQLMTVETTLTQSIWMLEDNLNNRLTPAYHHFGCRE